jgi:hypothetical protein
MDKPSTITAIIAETVNINPICGSVSADLEL